MIEVHLEQDDPSTFNNYRKHLGCIFTHFKKEIPFNPIEEIKPRQDSVEHITLRLPRFSGHQNYAETSAVWSLPRTGA